MGAEPIKETRWGRVGRAPRPTSASALPVACMLVVVVAIVGRVGFDLFPEWQGLRVAPGLLSMGAVALGVASAVVADVSGRLSGDSRATWMTAAPVLYGVIVIPSATLWPGQGTGGVAGSVLTVALVVGLVMLVVAWGPPGRLTGNGAWLVGGAGSVLALAGGPALHGLSGISSLLGTVTTEFVLVVWCVVAVRFVSIGGVGGRSPLRWVGLGVLMVAASHLDRVIIGADFSQPAFDLGWLLGSLVALLGTIGLAGQAIRSVHLAQAALQEEARVAVVKRQRAMLSAAERDHELRNGLVVLSGAAALLFSAGGRDTDRLRSAVQRELSRLARLVDGSPTPADAGFDLGEALTEVATLATGSGAQMTVDCPSHVRVAGTRTVFAHVITNVLANCARHAPGSPVSIRGRVTDDTITITITDEGPGVQTGLGHRVGMPGVRNSSTGGQGLGLHICRKLLTGVGGRIHLLTAGPNQRGCTVVIELPSLARTCARGKVSLRPSAIIKPPMEIAGPVG